MSESHDREIIGGHLLVIGGAEDKYNERRILKKFLEIAGGTEAEILIIPVASDFPEFAADVYTQAFRNLGVARPRVLRATSRQDIVDADVEGLLDGVKGIFMTGGDQMRLVSLLGGTKLAEKIRSIVRSSNVVLAGTSAGAAAMSTTMVVRGDPSSHPHKAAVRLSPGLGFLSVSQKALAAAKSAGHKRCYFSFEDMIKTNDTGYFPYTPPTQLLRGLEDEGLVAAQGHGRRLVQPHAKEQAIANEPHQRRRVVAVHVLGVALQRGCPDRGGQHPRRRQRCRLPQARWLPSPPGICRPGCSRTTTNQQAWLRARLGQLARPSQPKCPRCPIGCTLWLPRRRRPTRIRPSGRLSPPLFNRG